MTKKKVAFYSIIQYVPYPIADERINIGVLTFNEVNVRFQALKDWTRVKAFGKENIDFLYRFVQRMEECAKNNLVYPGDEHDNKPLKDKVIDISNSWMNSIQLTEPRPSLANIDKLLIDIIGDFLIEPKSNNEKHK
jgi:hypothetical protein